MTLQTELRGNTIYPKLLNAPDICLYCKKEGTEKKSIDGANTIFTKELFARLKEGMFACSQRTMKEYRYHQSCADRYWDIPEEQGKGLFCKGEMLLRKFGEYLDIYGC